jgi:endonuclease YncB( thermonuclease family)
MTEEIRFRFALKKNTYRVIDGDTVEVVLDRGFQDEKTVKLRLLGCDAPEKSTRKNLLEREAGQLVKEVVDLWLSRHWSDDVQFYASSEIRSKYQGRAIGRLWVGKISEELGSFLLAGGVVRPYTGGKRLPWTAAELDPIIANARAYLDTTDDRD